MWASLGGPEAVFCLFQRDSEFPGEYRKGISPPKDERKGQVFVGIVFSAGNVSSMLQAIGHILLTCSDLGRH